MSNWLGEILATAGHKRVRLIHLDEDIPIVEIWRAKETVGHEDEYEALEIIESEYKGVRKYVYETDWLPLLGPPPEWDQMAWRTDDGPFPSSYAGISLREGPLAALAVERGVRGIKHIVGEVLGIPEQEVDQVVHVLKPGDVDHDKNASAYTRAEGMYFKERHLSSCPDRMILDVCLHELAHYMITQCGFDDLADVDETEGSSWHGPLWILLALKLGSAATETDGNAMIRSYNDVSRPGVHLQCTNEGGEVCPVYIPYKRYAKTLGEGKSYLNLRCVDHGKPLQHVPIPGFETPDEINNFVLAEVRKRYPPPHPSAAFTTPPTPPTPPLPPAHPPSSACIVS